MSHCKSNKSAGNEDLDNMQITNSFCVSTNKKQISSINQSCVQRSQKQSKIKIPLLNLPKNNTPQDKTKQLNLYAFEKLSQRISQLQSILLEDKDVFTQSAIRFQEKLNQSIRSIKSFHSHYQEQSPKKYQKEDHQEAEILNKFIQDQNKLIQKSQNREISKQQQNIFDQFFKNNMLVNNEKQIMKECNMQQSFQEVRCQNCIKKLSIIKKLDNQNKNLSQKIKIKDEKISSLLKQTKIIKEYVDHKQDDKDSIDLQNQRQIQVDAAGSNFLLSILNQKIQQSNQLSNSIEVKNYIERLMIDLPSKVEQIQSNQLKKLIKEKEDYKDFGQCKKHSGRFIKKLCLNRICKNHRFLCSLCQEDHRIHHTVQLNSSQIDELLKRIPINSKEQNSKQLYDYFSQKAEKILNFFQKGLKKLHRYQRQFYSKYTPILNAIKQSFNPEAFEQAEFILKKGNFHQQEIFKEKIEYYVGIINQNKTNNFSKYSPQFIPLKQIVNFNEHLFLLKFNEIFNVIDSHFQQSMKRFQELNKIDEQIQDNARSFCSLKCQNLTSLNFKKIHLSPNINLKGFKNGFKIKDSPKVCIYSGIGGVISLQSLPLQGFYSFTIKPLKLNDNKRIYIGLVAQDHINDINNIGTNSVLYRLQTRTIYKLNEQIKVKQADNSLKEKPMIIDVNMNMNENKISWVYNSKIQASCKLPQQWITSKKKIFAEIYLCTEGDIIQFK